MKTGCFLGCLLFAIVIGLGYFYLSGSFDGLVAKSSAPSAVRPSMEDMRSLPATASSSTTSSDVDTITELADSISSSSPSSVGDLLDWEERPGSMVSSTSATTLPRAIPIEIFDETVAPSAKPVVMDSPKEEIEIAIAAEPIDFGDQDMAELRRALRAAKMQALNES